MYDTSWVDDGRNCKRVGIVCTPGIVRWHRMAIFAREASVKLKASMGQLALVDRKAVIQLVRESEDGKTAYAY